MLVVFTTTSDFVEGEKLARSLVNAKLAACVQILPKVTSVYSWEGKIRKDEEFLLIIKSLPEKYPELEAFIAGNHSYDVPEIVAIDAEHTSASYHQWLSEYLADRPKTLA